MLGVVLGSLVWSLTGLTIEGMCAIVACPSRWAVIYLLIVYTMPIAGLGAFIAGYSMPDGS